MCTMDMSDEDYICATISKAFSCYEIQRTITRYLDVGDLKAVRLVDRNWRQLALISLKEKSHVTFDCPSTFQKYFTFLEDTNYSACFTKYRIIFKPGKFGCAADVCSLFDQFWTMCSECVKDIHITMPWTCAFPILHCMFYPSTKIDEEEQVRTPLEKLSLSVEDADSGDKWLIDKPPEEEKGSITMIEKEESTAAVSPVAIYTLISLNFNVSIVLNSEKKVFPFTWQEFFTSCPNVRHLCIQSDYASGHFCRIVNVLVDKGIGLKTLKIGTRDQRLFSDEFQRKLQLLANDTTHTLSLGFLPSVRSDTPLNTILSKSSGALKHLTLLQYRTSNQAQILCFTASDVSAFPELTCLRITKELLPHLNFLTRMPKLRRLEIYRDSTIGQHDTLSNPVIRTRSLPVMDNLQCLVMEPFVPVEHVWKLVRWFPGLTKLQMKVNDVIARIIFTTWTGLKELYLIAEISRDNNDIIRSTLTDEGITGISREILQQAHQFEVNDDGLPDAGDQSRISGHRDAVYIGNLTKLEILKLQAVPDYQTGLTDFSVHYGFRDLPCLTALTLVKTLVSPAGADTLKKQGVYVTVSKD